MVTGQRLTPDRAVLACRLTGTDPWCRRCGCEGEPRDSVPRRLAHEPLGWRPTTLLVAVRRYACTGFGHMWRQDTAAAAEPKAKLSRRALRWALEAVVCFHLSMSRVAQGLGVSWATANKAVLVEGRRVLIADPPGSTVCHQGMVAVSSAGSWYGTGPVLGCAGLFVGERLDPGVEAADPLQLGAVAGDPSAVQGPSSSPSPTPSPPSPHSWPSSTGTAPATTAKPSSTTPGAASHLQPNTVLQGPAAEPTHNPPEPTAHPMRLRCGR